MRVEFFIHGVLSTGQNCSMPEEYDYAKLFYRSQAENEVMIVEVMKRPEGLCTYYNYLRYNNIHAERSGSYLGVTVRMDGFYCTDLKGMYFILSSLFENMIVGKLMDKTESGYKYRVMTLKEGEGKRCVDQAEKQFFQMIQAFVPQDNYKPLTSAASVGTGMVYKVHPTDLSSKVGLEAMAKMVRVYVSPTYPLAQMREINEVLAKQQAIAKQQMKEAEEQAAQRVEQINQTLRATQRQMETSRKEIETLNEQKRQLERELKRVRMESKMGEVIVNTKKSVDYVGSRLRAIVRDLLTVLIFIGVTALCINQFCFSSAESALAQTSKVPSLPNQSPLNEYKYENHSDSLSADDSYTLGVRS